MAFFEYYCEANGKTVEVAHPMSMKLGTWREVCFYAGMDMGTTPPDTPVIRLIGGMPFVEKLKGLDKDAPSTKLEL
jgi:hypothetical protein